MVDENKKLSIEDLATFCKKKGFVFQAAEIYGGLSGFFDFGPLGVKLKNNLKELYRSEFVTKRQDMSEQDGSIITNPKVWKSSGHIDNFGDLVLTTKTSKTKIRADHFIEDTLNIPADGMNAQDIQNLIDEHNLTYNGEEFEEIRDFNLMFNTQVGADTSKTATAYLRPETCQSIFPNFKIIAEVMRHKLPFGIVQMGKAFRNEISPRDFVFRCREFEQIEMEYFFNPENEEELTSDILDYEIQFWSAKHQDNDDNSMEKIKVLELLNRELLCKTHVYWIVKFMEFLVERVGISFENLRIREHVSTELSHYSKGTFDIDYKYPFGFKEMIGIANRGNFDLTEHGKGAKTKMELFDEETKSKILPYCIEPSCGVERFLMAVMFEAYNNDENRGNIVLNFSNKIAPIKVAVLPLMNKVELTNVAESMFESLIDEDIVAVYDKSGSVGKRYARYDEIGVPYCLTVDYDGIEQGEDFGTVTIRDRNSTKQKRIKISEVYEIIDKLIKGKVDFEQL